jgi:hypothetical protein
VPTRRDTLDQDHPRIDGCTLDPIYDDGMIIGVRRGSLGPGCHQGTSGPRDADDFDRDRRDSFHRDADASGIRAVHDAVVGDSAYVDRVISGGMFRACMVPAGLTARAFSAST